MTALIFDFHFTGDSNLDFIQIKFVVSCLLPLPPWDKVAFSFILMYLKGPWLDL